MVVSKRFSVKKVLQASLQGSFKTAIYGSLLLFILHLFGYKLVPNSPNQDYLWSSKSFGMNWSRMTKFLPDVTQDKGTEYIVKANTDCSEDVLKQLSFLTHKAYVHAKSLKSRKYLRDSIDILKKSIGKHYFLSTQRNLYQPETVCEEVFRKHINIEVGSPHAWLQENCTYATPLDLAVTIVTVFNQEDRALINQFISSVTKAFPGVHMILGLPQSPKVRQKGSEYKTFVYSKKMTNGLIWHNALDQVDTEYVLFVPNTVLIDNNLDLFRLIRVHEKTKISAVSGATRDVSKKTWAMGCYQTTLFNYRLTYHEGYDESILECVICDHVDSPFLMKSEQARKVGFDVKIKDYGVFEDFFLRLGQEGVALCPDVMFHVIRREPPKELKLWHHLVKKWQIKQISYPNLTWDFSCFIPEKCQKKTTFSISPCCNRQLKKMIEYTYELCIKTRATCEISSGTLLGALKLNDILPWEYDADIVFLLNAHNFTAIDNLRDQMSFTESQYVMSRQVEPLHDQKGNLIKGGFAVKSSNWVIELYGWPNLTSVQSGLGSTLIRLGNRMYPTATNPGRWCRNRYGKEIYKHAQHWRILKLHFHTDEYEPKESFIPCDITGNHKCIDAFRTDGSLQLVQVLP